MSDLADKLKNAKPSRKITLMESILERLEKEDPEGHDELMKALRDPHRVSQRAIALILTGAGYAISNPSIQKWRSENLK